MSPDEVARQLIREPSRARALEDELITLRPHRRPLPLAIVMYDDVRWALRSGIDGHLHMRDVHEWARALLFTEEIGFEDETARDVVDSLAAHDDPLPIDAVDAQRLIDRLR